MPDEFPPAVLLADERYEMFREKWATCLSAQLSAPVVRALLKDVEQSYLALAAPQAPASQVDCPLCGMAVAQVASATLSLALWQHVNWACKGVAAPQAPALDQEARKLADELDNAVYWAVPPDQPIARKAVREAAAALRAAPRAPAAPQEGDEQHVCVDGDTKRFPRRFCANCNLAIPGSTSGAPR